MRPTRGQHAANTRHAATTLSSWKSPGITGEVWKKVPGAINNASHSHKSITIESLVTENLHHTSLLSIFMTQQAQIKTGN